MKIKFSHNWNNKLDNNIFTTIRRWTPRKFKYYNDHVFDLFDIELNGKRIGSAILMGVSRKAKLEEIDEADPMLLQLDTGSAEPFEVFKMFGVKPKTDVIVLLFQKTWGGKK